MNPACSPRGGLGQPGVSQRLPSRAPAPSLSLTLSTHSPATGRSLHRKSEKARVLGRKQAEEVAPRRPGRSSSEAAGLRLPAWETGE